MSREAILLLEDGTEYHGLSFGADAESIGEVVFNTSMSGYQEILHDPSYCKQIVTMTYPEIGNTGINPEDIESGRVWVSGFVVKNYQDIPSNFRSKQSLGSFLKEKGIVAIQGIDTRALTQKIRDGGAQMGILSTTCFEKKTLMARLKKEPKMEGRDLVREVSCKEPYEWTSPLWVGPVAEAFPDSPPPTQMSVVCRETTVRATHRTTRHPSPSVIVYDYGVKYNILRSLVSAGCRVKVVPAGTPAELVLKDNPDGIFLSNGPGDPAAVVESIGIVKKLIGQKPIFGICLGHQILSLALGAKTFKLKFGHRGANQPVMDLKTGKVEITSQNHGFAVDPETLKSKATISHINLNDKTVEGLENEKLKIMSVQYHPEASPGPHDSHYLFKRFVEMMNAKTH